MSLALLFHYLVLNMFRMLIQPSSGACDLFDEFLHGLYGSGSMCVSVALWWRGICMQAEALFILSRQDVPHHSTTFCRSIYCTYWYTICMLVFSCIISFEQILNCKTLFVKISLLFTCLIFMTEFCQYLMCWYCALTITPYLFINLYCLIIIFKLCCILSNLQQALIG